MNYFIQKKYCAPYHSVVDMFLLINLDLVQYILLNIVMQYHEKFSTVLPKINFQSSVDG